MPTDNIYDYIDHKKNILINENELQEMIKEIALKISLDYRDKHIVMIGILKGATMFMMDLCRSIIVPLVYDFISVSSYEGMNSTGIVNITKDITENIKDKHVIIVDDIYDTGLTLNYVSMHLLSLKPASIKICVLLNKQSQKKAQIKINYKGFDVPDEFVVGYGLDFDGKFRNLPFICSIKE
jgi:hypoxanthine phosphoribosyltransferase